MAPVAREPTKNVCFFDVVMPSGWKPCCGIVMTSGRLPFPFPWGATAGTATAALRTSARAIRILLMLPEPPLVRMSDLHEHIRTHGGCGFAICDGALNLVPGEGPDDADVMVVGKARPPGNRDPTRAEVEHWMPVLEQQLALIGPQLVVPLGRHALAHFAPG